MMFEEYPQTEFDDLMKVDTEFRQLYYQHRTLNKKCMDAELGVLPIGDVTLGEMKREKLATKERLLKMFAERHVK